MTFALGTPHRGQTIAPDVDLFAMNKLLLYLRPSWALGGSPKMRKWLISA